MELSLKSRYKTRQLIYDEEVEDRFNCINCFESNVYIGTELGQLLHYHRFDDSPQYILISQQKIRSSCVSKILVLPIARRVVVLCGGSMNLFSLPELSPIQSGKLKDIENILKLNDKDIMILMKNKMKVIRLQEDIRLLGDIEVSAKMAVSMGKSAVIANDKEYQLINLQNSSKTPLFQYRQDEDVPPNIVAFDANDSGQKEVLLTINSDGNTSMGMFINSNGDPTRGTFTWIDKGYPNNGIAIEWPYVFAIFNGQLVVSSLISLDIMETINVEGKMVFLDIPASVQDDNYLTNGICKQALSSKMVILRDKQVDLLFLNEVDDFLSELTKYINGEVDKIKLIDSDDELYKQLRFLYLIHKKEYDSIEIDDTLLSILSYLNGGEGSFFQGTQKIADLVKPKLDDDFNQFFIEQIRKQYLQTHKLSLQKQAYSNLKNDEDFIDLVTKDKDSWRIKTPNLVNIIKNLESQQFYRAMLHAYTLLQDDENICVMAVAFLSGKYPGDDTDYVEMILKSLDKVKDDKIYRDSLLEILRVDSSKGIAYMKKNVKGKHTATHSDIMKEMINLSKNEDFASLKLEILENTYKDGKGGLEEILDHLIEMLKYPNEVQSNNFMILFETFKIENTFDSHKNITSFVNYLQMIKDATECKEFIEIYLKAYELINYLNSDNYKQIIDMYPYFKVFDKEIEDIIKIDFFTAEFLAVHGKPPYPDEKYFVEEQLTDVLTAKNDLLKVFVHYKDTQDTLAMKHFIKMYENYFTANEIIDLLPSEMSLSIVQDYFINLFINIDSIQRKLIIRKIFNRQEATVSKNLYKDFTSESNK